MLWPAISTEPAIEDINHQWRSGSCSKECTARIHVQAASDRYEQKHKQADNHVVLYFSMHRYSPLTFSHVML